MSAPINTDNRVCTRCGKEFHWLEEFPGCVCLSCWEIKNINTTMEEYARQIAGVFGKGGSK